MKRFAAMCMLALGIFALAGCGNKETETGKQTEIQTEAAESESDTELLSGTHHVEIDVEDYGTVSVELDADSAPISVTNFVNLAKEGFYDGLTFHRIIDGFMIQGGDPEGTGIGGSDQTIKGEFSDNGVENELSNTRGAIAMARSAEYDSASSQFYIVQTDSIYLDGQYAVFGYVTSGMEIVDQICKDTPVQDSNGTVSAGDQPIITAVRVTD